MSTRCRSALALRNDDRNLEENRNVAAEKWPLPHETAQTLRVPLKNARSPASGDASGCSKRDNGSVGTADYYLAFSPIGSRLHE